MMFVHGRFQLPTLLVDCVDPAHNRIEPSVNLVLHCLEALIDGPELAVRMATEVVATSLGARITDIDARGSPSQ